MAKAEWEAHWEHDPESSERSGGQGSVRRVHSRVTGVAGALKQLHPTHVNNLERRQRMAREVLALQAVHGEGVPAVLEHNMAMSSDIGTSLYFVSQWVPGHTLQHFAGGNPKSISSGLRIAHRLAEIVERCHRVGVFHRDIKPDNIIIDQETLEITLVDFGTAWADGTLMFPIPSRLKRAKN